MKCGIILVGVVLACGTCLSSIAIQAATAPQGAIVVADNDHDKNNNSHPPPGGGMHGPQPQVHSGGNPMMGGHNMMGSHGAPHPNFDRHAFQRNFAAPRHFHIGGYVRPPGWYDHHWGYGEILPALFWAQNYWLNNYSDYGLAVPPPGFVWVRDGDDALLVDTSTGEILQVEYGVFD